MKKKRELEEHMKQFSSIYFIYHRYSIQKICS